MRRGDRDPRRVSRSGGGTPCRETTANASVSGAHGEAGSEFYPSGGDEGIRTLDTLLGYTPLAGERLRPLGHVSADGDACNLGGRQGLLRGRGCPFGPYSSQVSSPLSCAIIISFSAAASDPSPSASSPTATHPWLSSATLSSSICCRPRTIAAASASSLSSI